MKLKTFLAGFNLFNRGKNFLWPGTMKNSPMLKKISALFKEKRVVGIIYLDIVRFHDLEQLMGQDVAEKIINRLQKILIARAPHLITSSELLAIHNLWGDDFVIYFAPTSKPSAQELLDLAVAIRLDIKYQLNNSLTDLIPTPLELHVGQSLAMPSPFKVEHQIYTALKEAYRMAKDSFDLQSIKLRDDFKEILDKKNLQMFYQPIVSLKTGRSLGWEALTRGPQDSHFHSPGVLFPFAEEVNLLYNLEKVTRELAITQVEDFSPDYLLFLNINPRTINDPEFIRGETKKLLDLKGLTPQNIVFEITERNSINDFNTFKRTLEHYRSQGYLIAVDDAGAGYSSLQSIAEIHPDFIKMDMSLIQGISNNPVKKSLLETFVTFAQKINCEIIAEGIETAEELMTLAAMGIHYGQGFYLARPGKDFPSPQREALELIYHTVANRLVNKSSRQTYNLGEIIKEAPTVTPHITVKRVREIFEEDPLINGIIVLKDRQPYGLVMRQNLYYHLGSQYGAALYFERPITAIMDTRPLILDAETPIDLAAQIAMNRTSIKLYDYITVTREGAFAGIVSIQNLLDTITKIKIELAKWSNPLSGLPGNPQIEDELIVRLSKELPFAVIYADLDRFKSYNDNYGFEYGDKVILFTARLISHMVRKYGTTQDFVGHIGGDDFIIITHPEKVDEICSRIIRCFDRLIPRFFARDQKEKKNGNLTISLAAVESWQKQSSGHLHIAEIAAELKRAAKAQEGSIYIKDHCHL